MDRNILDNTYAFIDDLISEVSSNEALNKDQVLDIVLNDQIVSEHLFKSFKRMYNICEKYIDADRIGELLIESNLSAEDFDKYIADE